jgi:hypothetical protein
MQNKSCLSYQSISQDKNMASQYHKLVKLQRKTEKLLLNEEH